jgi:dUTP pyrophosphatase
MPGRTQNLWKTEKKRRINDEEKHMKIRIKYFVDIEPIKILPGGDWIDLRAAETVEMKAGEYRLIRLGVGMELPKGYEAHIMPRSSTYKNYGLLMACSGIIDNAYKGDADEWKFGAVAMRDTKIEKGDRICQFRVMNNQPPIEFETVEKLGGVSRGGFGSTGKQ